ncbi:MAG: galactose-1-phosphate uridylyltransferase [Candidatus Aminicenantales bacterium]
MSQLRKDIISGRWVIIASERSKRPDDFRPPQTEKTEKREDEEKFCPFCEGSESKTPPEVFSLRTPGTQVNKKGWRVRVVPNKFPALNRGGLPDKHKKGVFEWMDGVGVHEVVIESPDHQKELVDLPLPHIRDVLWTYRERITSIEKESQYQYIQIFKNKGKEAGASLTHPHSQIVATPIIPKRLKEEVYGAERAYRKFKECVICRILKEERAAKERLILSNRHFCVTAPFASRFPFEMRITPIRHSPYYASLNADELQSLAEILKDVLSRLKNILSDPPFNYFIHQGPNPELSREVWPEMDKVFHWHFEVIPILSRVAGFEWGTGFYINPVPPELASEFMRG